MNYINTIINTVIMWEYKTEYKGVHEVNLSHMETYLNKKGKEGWELVYIISKNFRDNVHEFANHTFIFKRQSK